mgnify:CR=1 FL=1
MEVFGDNSIIIINTNSNEECLDFVLKLFQLTKHKAPNWNLGLLVSALETPDTI